MPFLVHEISGEGFRYRPNWQVANDSLARLFLALVPWSISPSLRSLAAFCGFSVFVFLWNRRLRISAYLMLHFSFRYKNFARVRDSTFFRPIRCIADLKTLGLIDCSLKFLGSSLRSEDRKRCRKKFLTAYIIRWRGHPYGTRNFSRLVDHFSVSYYRNNFFFTLGES